MPREYIVKLVFDPTHRTIIVRKTSAAQQNNKNNESDNDMNCANSNVVGGITYRAFKHVAHINVQNATINTNTKDDSTKKNINNNNYGKDNGNNDDDNKNNNNASDMVESREYKFGEIAFCAVLAAQQVKGKESLLLLFLLLSY